MSPAAPFLAAIREAPDDDGPRLIYADWLDEHGEPERAEFIRVQCALAKCDTTALRHREAQLLAAHHNTFAASLATPHLRFRFHRGFITGFGHTGVFQSLEPDRKVARAPSHLLRLWPDGWMISATTAQPVDGPPDWLNRHGDGQFPEGPYSLDAVELPVKMQAICRTQADTLTFAGIWDDGSLILHMFNRRFGRQWNRHFIHVHILDFDSFSESP